MATRSDHALLPPESAAAIYSAIESLGSSLRKEQSDFNVRYDHDRRESAKRGDDMRGSLDEIKDLLRDGNVKFAESDAALRAHSDKIQRLDSRVSDVESDVQAAAVSRSGRLRPSSCRTGSGGLETKARRNTWSWVKDNLYRALTLLAAALCGFAATKINEIAHRPDPAKEISQPATPPAKTP